MIFITIPLCTLGTGKAVADVEETLVKDLFMAGAKAAGGAAGGKAMMEALSLLGLSQPEAATMNEIRDELHRDFAKFYKEIT